MEVPDTKPVEVFVYLQPAPGKFDQLLKECVDVANVMEVEEPDTVTFKVWDYEDGANQFIVLHEIYPDKATYEAHSATDHMKALEERIRDDGLFMAAPKTVFVKLRGGFSR